DSVFPEKSRFVGNPKRRVLRRNRCIRNRHVGELSALRREHRLAGKETSDQNKPAARFGQDCFHARRFDSARCSASVSARRKIALSAFFLYAAEPRMSSIGSAPSRISSPACLINASVTFLPRNSTSTEEPFWGTAPTPAAPTPISRQVALALRLNCTAALPMAKSPATFSSFT